MLIAYGLIWVNGLTALPVLEHSPLWLGTACQAADISFPLSPCFSPTRGRGVPA